MRRTCFMPASFAWRLTVALRPYGPSAPVRLRTPARRGAPITKKCRAAYRLKPIAHGPKLIATAQMSHQAARRKRQSHVSRLTVSCLPAQMEQKVERFYLMSAPPASEVRERLQKCRAALLLKRIPHGARRIATAQIVQKAERRK